MFDFWLFVLLGGAVVFLWRRVDRLEAQLRQITGRGVPAPSEPTGIADALPASRPEPDEQPKPGAGPATEAEFAPSSTAETVAVGQSEATSVEPAGLTETAAPRFTLSFDFEDLFGRLLPIWAGGVALAVAGFFLVRWSIEAGLLTVSVRVTLGFLFGIALLLAAEAAYRMEHRVADARVRQALAGAGIATLYASFYLAGSFYGLIGATVAFLGLAGTTAVAIALSFRFGLPSAVIGLVGGFAAPALVGSEEANLPVLTLYLALVAGGLTFTGRRQDRAWLGVASLAGGLGWGFLLVVAGAGSGASVVALGAYLVVLGAVLPAFTSGGGRPGLWVRIAAAAIASAQLAALVHQGGYGMLEWGLYLLLGGALAWFGWRTPSQREANAVAAAVALFLLAFWPDPAPFGFAVVGLAVTAIFAGVPLAQLWKAEWRWLDVAQVCGVALGLAAVIYGQFGNFAAGRSEPLLALAIFALAGLPTLAASLVWPERGKQLPRSALAAVGCAAALVGTAGLVAAPAWAAPLVGVALVAGLLALDRRRGDEGIVFVARGAALASLALLVGLPQTSGLAGHEFSRMVGYDYPGLGFDWRSSPRWLAAALAFGALLRRERDHRWHAAEQVLCVLAAYGAIVQLVPTDGLPWTVALAGIALAWRVSGRSAALATLLVLAGLWALLPLGDWVLAGMAALAGEAPPLDQWPSARAVLLRLAPLAVLVVGALTLALHRGEAAHRRSLAAGGAVLIAAVHSLYRHGFAAVAGTDFAQSGMAQRTVWELALLGAAGAALAAGRGRAWCAPAAAGLAALSLAHFAWFTLGLHNPLWSEQAVGSLPLANWLLPAYAAGAGALLVLRRTLPEPYAPLRWIADAALMALIVLLALSELRHLFSGSLLTAVAMGQGEDLLRSVLGIVAAIGFLLWGARSNTRSWRIGSLVLMLLAVLKVFLLDAAGLEGLARIASFMALGFSLIGIGWFYARQLKAPAMRGA